MRQIHMCSIVALIYTLSFLEKLRFRSTLLTPYFRYADTYAHLLLDRSKNEVVRRELAERPWNMDGQEIPRPQYAHLFGKRSQSAIEKSMANRTRVRL